MRIHISRSVVPNFFTVLNIFLGFLSILYAMQGKFVLAIWYILFAAVCDALDGFMARLTKSASEFGVELDSLADVVSFGVAPSFFMYKLFLENFGPLGQLVSAMPLIFGALRLARFNVQLVGFSKSYFNGLPIPLSAMTLLSYVLFFGPAQIRQNPPLQYALLGLIVACAFLMVSMIRYPVIPKISARRLREHPVQLALALAGAALLIVTGLKALFPILFTLVLSGVLLAAGRGIVRLARRAPDEEEELEPRTSHGTSHT
jgi:CDP-diacylglycerol--serine O-phosphatidyltransferase